MQSELYQLLATNDDIKLADIQEGDVLLGCCKGGTTFYGTVLAINHDRTEFLIRLHQGYTGPNQVTYHKGEVIHYRGNLLGVELLLHSRPL